MNVFTREQIQNCNDELQLWYLNYRVYTRERRLLWVCSLAFQSGEKKRGLNLWFSDMLIAISSEIWEFLLENAQLIGRSGYTVTQLRPQNHNSEVKAFIQWFCSVIWEMRHWKTPPDRHLNCAIQITLCDANLRTHGPKTVIRMIRNSNIVLYSHVKTLKDPHGDKFEGQYQTANLECNYELSPTLREIYCIN